MSTRSIRNNRYDIDQNIVPMPGHLWRLIGLPQAKAELPHLPIICGGPWRQKAVRYGYCYSMLRLQIFKPLNLCYFFSGPIMVNRKD